MLKSGSPPDYLCVFAGQRRPLGIVSRAATFEANLRFADCILFKKFPRLGAHSFELALGTFSTDVYSMFEVFRIPPGLRCI